MILSTKHLSMCLAVVIFLAVSVAFPNQGLSRAAMGTTVLSQWMKAKDIKNNVLPAKTAADEKAVVSNINPPAAPTENPNQAEPPEEEAGQDEPPQFEAPPPNPSLSIVPGADDPSQPETPDGDPNQEEPPPADQNQPEPAAENPDQNENTTGASQKE